jgi:hypothetical protein
VDDIKMGFRETGWEFVDWINLAQNTDEWPAFVNIDIDLQILCDTENF